MIDLNLFSKLLKDTQATMILTQKTDNTLEYHLIGKTLAYNIVTTGTCPGELDKKRVILNINLKLLNTLLRKDFLFDLSVNDGKAIFTTVKNTSNTMQLNPLCIEKNDETLSSTITNISNFLNVLDSNSNAIISYDFEKVRVLASLSSKNKEVIQMTKDFALVELNNVFVILKESVDSLALNGYVLNTLLNTGGKFYRFNNNLYFIDNNHKTFVIFNIVLPSPKIDLSILKRGAVLEHYVINIKNMNTVVSNLISDLNVVKMDFAQAKLIMSNDTGESLIYKFTISKADTVALKKLKENPKSNIKIEMSSITLPKQICSLLVFFNGEIDVFIYANKIIFRRGKLYLIFGR